LESDNQRPEIAAYRELNQLVRLLGDELANFRRRALQAESQLRSIEARGVSGAELRRLDALEAENVTLRRRVERGAEQAQAILERVRFLRQQHGQQSRSQAAAGGAGGGGER
jgi:hypothetical protein